MKVAAESTCLLLASKALGSEQILRKDICT